MQGLFRFSYIFLPSFSCVTYSSLSPYDDVSEYIYIYINIKRNQHPPTDLGYVPAIYSLVGKSYFQETSLLYGKNR